ncbi:hypothetical protein B296_00020711 [Ensete ventricosum]|uniref:Uncharacterized protein n=1 Tax=Ensete ventricosum TaxID=4639 RepID=A0A427AFE6_ENSVE|nr:hypothetical protein B296_00020711 [Ensete ventricosum]
MGIWEQYSMDAPAHQAFLLTPNVCEICVVVDESARLGFPVCVDSSTSVRERSTPPFLRCGSKKEFERSPPGYAPLGGFYTCDHIESFIGVIAPDCFGVR